MKLKTISQFHDSPMHELICVCGGLAPEKSFRSRVCHRCASINRYLSGTVAWNRGMDRITPRPIKDGINRHEEGNCRYKNAFRWGKAAVRRETISLMHGPSPP